MGVTIPRARRGAERFFFFFFFNLSCSFHRWGLRSPVNICNIGALISEVLLIVQENSQCYRLTCATVMFWKLPLTSLSFWSRLEKHYENHLNLLFNWDYFLYSFIFVKKTLLFKKINTYSWQTLRKGYWERHNLPQHPPTSLGDWDQYTGKCDVG